MSELMLSKQTLIKLLERASPDPCEPYGCDPWEPPPGGTEPPPDPHPRSHPLDWVRLNPQPLPPKGHWRQVLPASRSHGQSTCMRLLKHSLKMGARGLWG